jgi:hypothetical protein
MSAATESVQAEWAAKSVVLSELRSIGEWKRLSGNTDTHEQTDAALSRFLRRIGHGAVADQWERVR